MFAVSGNANASNRAIAMYCGFIWIPGETALKLQSGTDNSLLPSPHLDTHADCMKDLIAHLQVFG